jgi:hypothetical protein
MWKVAWVAMISALSGPAGAQISGEHLVQAKLPGFVVGHTAERGPMFIEELIPEGETVEQWTRMITKQRFAGTAGSLSPEELMSRMASGLAGGCPGGVAGAVRRFEVLGAAAAELRADCPKNPATGKPETFLAQAIAGPADIHVLQVAFRKMPSRDDVSWAKSHLASAVLCTATSRDPRCERR